MSLFFLGNQDNWRERLQAQLDSVSKKTIHKNLQENPES